MDVTKLREQTAAVRASKEEIEDAEFSTSLLRKYFDALIKEAATNGEGKISTNFYCAKEHILMLALEKFCTQRRFFLHILCIFKNYSYICQRIELKMPSKDENK